MPVGWDETLRRNPVIAGVLAWASTQEDVVALALVGSWARGNPHRHSDMDFIILSDAPRTRSADVGWTRALCRTFLHGRLKHWCNGFYGAVWSRHFTLASGQEIELSFGAQPWACTAPIDSGTRYVVQDAMVVLYDPLGLLATLQARVAGQSQYAAGDA